MNTPWITVAAIVALASFYVLLPLIVHTYQRYRRKRVLLCPETKGMAEVDVDAEVAAFTSAFGRPLLRVKDCSVWPRRRGCAQACLKE